MEELWAPSVEDFVAAAAVILDVEESAIRRLPGLALAESALVAPFAGLDDQDAYPSLTAKAAILIERLARNHPLPDGNKRVALALAIVFLEKNGRRWGPPDHARDVAMVEQIAAGVASTGDAGRWIDERTA